MRWLFLLLILPLFAQDEPFDPYAQILHSVNLAKGYYQESHTDLIVRGAEPIVIPRHHTSSDTRHLGAFEFPYEHIKTYQDDKGRNHTITLRTLSGLRLSFIPPSGAGYGSGKPHQWTAKSDAYPGYTHSGTGKTYLPNWQLTFTRKPDYQFELLCGDGERRIYTCLKRKNHWRAEHQIALSDVREEFVLTQITRPNGNHLHYAYDEKNRLIGIHATDSTDTETLSWVTIIYLHNTWNIAHLVASDGQRVDYLYESDHLTSVRRNGQTLVCYEYDDHGRLTHQRGPTGNYTAVHYLANSPRDWKKKKHDLIRIASLSAPIGPDDTEATLATFAYNNATTIYDALGNRTITHFTAQSQPSRIEHYDQEALTSIETFTYDYCRLTDHSLRSPDQTPLLAHRITYDPCGNPIQQTLHTTTTTTYSTDGFNNLLTQTDQTTTTFTYYPDTDLLHTRTSPSSYETFTYDTAGCPTSHTITDGYRTFTTLTTYNSSHLPETIAEYAADGLIKKSRHIYNNRLLPIATEVYDATDTLAYTLHYTYDPQDRLASQTDLLGYLTTYAYDAVGNPTTTTTPTHTTHVTYNARGLPTHITQSDPHVTLITTHTYDLLGNPTTTDPFGNTAHTTYNARGQPLTTPTATYTYDALGNRITEPLRTLTYNARGQPLTITDPLSTTTYTYDPYGNLLTTPTATYTYDDLNRPLTITDPLNRTTTHTYQGSLLASTTYPDNTTVTYAYNARGQLIAEDYEGALTTYTYDPLNRRITTTTHSTTTTTYDLLDRPLTITDPTTTTTYTYDPDGRPLAINDETSGLAHQKLTFHFRA
ncbi:MAG: RHS repeat domain-containing protein [Parachlamydiales bacterium]